MERRTFIKASASLALGTAAGLKLGAATAFAAQELRLLTWEGYADDAWVNPDSKPCGHLEGGNAQ